jgi:3-deoxy-D-manno-octulosonic-acid transferase
MLKGFNHCFVQDNTSLQLLREHNFLNSSLAMDTRFDAVIKRSEAAFSDEIIEEFINGQKTLIVGSSWPKDETIISEFIKHFKNLKIIVAPHDVNESRIKQLLKTFPQAALYSNGIDKRAAQVLIIDRIGILSLLYRYGDICYIGGGFDTSVHNVLEAAVYGKPLLYGPNHSKSKEAKDLVALNAALVLSDKSGNHKTLTMLMNEDFSNEARQISAQYVKERAGGTETITKYLLGKRFI